MLNEHISLLLTDADSRDVDEVRNAHARVPDNAYLACLHDQNKSGFFGGPTFIQPIREIWKFFKKPWLVGKKPALQKSHFWFDHVNRLIIILWRLTHLESRNAPASICCKGHRAQVSGHSGQWHFNNLGKTNCYFKDFSF